MTEENTTNEAPTENKVREPLKRFSCTKFTDEIGTVPGLRRHLAKSKSIKIVSEVTDTAKTENPGYSLITEEAFQAALAQVSQDQEDAIRTERKATAAALRAATKAEKDATKASAQPAGDPTTLSVKELRALAKASGVKGFSGMTQEQLIEALTPATTDEPVTADA